LKITRTANAGVLLETDGVSILLDGVCGHIPPYFATDDIMRQYLIENPPDVLAFTHKHIDHYDMDYINYYEDNKFGQVMLPEYPHQVTLNGTTVCPVITRHIGKTDVEHCSYIIDSDIRVWFMGDATPLSLKNFHRYPKPDLLIVPFAYALSDYSWKSTKSICARKIILLHMPDKNKDDYGIWDTVDNVTKSDECLLIPELREQVIIK
jgi:L-ascorbate metabolism protein UlaG (beta-lactamase superfamily)